MANETVARLLAERDRLAAELAEWEALGELTRRREQPWIERWQKETGKAHTLPDYGDMLAWLVARLDHVTEERDTAIRTYETQVRQYNDAWRGQVDQRAMAIEECATLCERMGAYTGGHGEPSRPAPGDYAAAIRGLLPGRCGRRYDETTRCTLPGGHAGWCSWGPFPPGVATPDAGR